MQFSAAVQSAKRTIAILKQLCYNYHKTILWVRGAENAGCIYFSKLCHAASDNSDSGDNVWKLYEIADRDWEKSPASELSGYDESTNTINGYKYGTSASDKQTNPFIHAL